MFVNALRKRRGSSQLFQNDRLHTKPNPEVPPEVLDHNILTELMFSSCSCHSLNVRHNLMSY